MKRALFIDRDGTLIAEPPVDFQVDSLEKLEFIPGVIRALYNVQKSLDFELVMVTNQDGLGTDSFPEADFHPTHNKMLNIFRGEDVIFDNQLIDKTFEHEGANTRKPGTGMFGEYLSGEYDLANSFVIGDRVTDVELAKNLGAKGILFGTADRVSEIESGNLTESCSLISDCWDDIYTHISLGERVATVKRDTSETKIDIELNLDGTGKAEISTGLSFFDHMLDQIARHSGCDLKVIVKGDLNVDEHHTIEDTGIALGEAFLQALGSKIGIERYGFTLPMDDCLVQVALDFGGRSWLVWSAEFKREFVGDMPTEMFYHFFKSFSDAAKMNLNIEAQGVNEHHKIEGIFKGLAKAIKMAKNRTPYSNALPSTKGVL